MFHPETFRKTVLRTFFIPTNEYKKFPRRKTSKSGQVKVRWIHAPCPNLKKIQRMILSKVLYLYASHPCSHAYTAGKNIRSNAYLHISKPYSIVLDIKDFFPSISREMLREALLFQVSDLELAKQNDFFAWDDKIISYLEKIINEVKADPNEITTLEILLELCTLDGFLPQGAPTSGALSNIVMYPLDSLFETLSVQHNFVYTRYADDLTFSGDDLEKLKKIVFGYVFHKLEEAGFIINRKKVHVLKGDQRIITGLNIHKEGVRPSRKYRRKLRARLANLRKKFQECKNLEEMHEVLKQEKGLRRELGHYWYILYTDTYSTNVNDYVTKYFLPIADAIAKFYPGFADCETETFNVYNLHWKPASTFGSHLGRKTLNVLNDLNRDFVKMKRSLTNTIEYKSLGRSFLSCFKRAVAVTYRVRRNLINCSLESDSSLTFGHEMNLKTFCYAYRMASPEDKLAFLKKVIQGQVLHRSIWYRLCTYGSRHSYNERLELLRTIANQTVFLGGNGAERFSARCSIRKIMRGLNVEDLIEFVTSGNENIRITTSDYIALKNKRAARTSNKENTE